MDINSIIDNLCSKFGTTAACLIPEMARYNIAMDMIVIVVSLLGLFFGYAIIKAGLLKYKTDMKQYEDDKNRYCKPDLFCDYISYWGIGGFLGIIFTILLLVNLCDCVGWMISPTAAFTTELLNVLKGGS